jgi:hypothetical protein
MLMVGVVQAISPSGTVARVSMGARIFSNIPLDHLEPASVRRP